VSEQTQPEITPVDELARDESGRWRKGVSPNPGGRSKAMTEVRRAIEARGPELVSTLMGIALPPSPPEDLSPKDMAALLARRSADQLKALELLFAYWLGRPVAAVEVSTPDGSVARAALELAQLRAAPSTAAALLVLAEAQAAMGRAD
jgi:hypothetical protein